MSGANFYKMCIQALFYFINAVEKRNSTKTAFSMLSHSEQIFKYVLSNAQITNSVECEFWNIEALI